MKYIIISIVLFGMSLLLIPIIGIVIGLLKKVIAV
jgi:hypothetical protein